MTAWLRRLRPADDDAVTLRLVCFPHAGGAATAYTPLARQLPAWIEPLSVQYPGRQDRRAEPGIEDIPALAELVVGALGEELPTGPYAFFGHSMGALVAYETARRLPASEGPVRLFLSGRAAPVTGPAPGDELHGDAALIAQMRRLGGTGAQVFDDPDLLEIVMPAVRTDYRALRSYSWTPGPALDVPLTVLVGDADPLAPVPDATAWGKVSDAATDVRVFEGGHFYLDGQAARVAQAVTEALTP